MNRYIAPLFTLILAGCSGDPPLLKTELSNGNVFHSNGGRTGYFANKEGNRYADIFGIIGPNKERWCEGFAWSNSHAICKTESGNEYVVLNTLTDEISIHSSEYDAKEYWKTHTGENTFELKKRYANTKRK